MRGGGKRERKEGRQKEGVCSGTEYKRRQSLSETDVIRNVKN